jgi:pimeloyl-ACP methyl ester carboxylesterase
VSDQPRSDFVTVGGLRLHYLDWGGHGEPLVLVPGTGQSPWVFAELAPLLTEHARVIGLSPHAHGPSETPGRGYRLADFADEVMAFLDALGIGRAALAGHSLAGTIVTRCAVRWPARVSRLVYLDAVYDYDRWGVVQRRNPVRPPPPPVSAREPDEAEKEWLRRYFYGFWSPGLEADWAARPAREVSVRRRDLFSELVDDAVRSPAEYTRVRCPALALVAAEAVETVFPWLEPEDAERAAEARRFLEEVRGPWRRAGIERFRREMRGGSVVEVGGHHYLFVTQRDRVAAEAGAFLARTAPRAGTGAG